MGILQFDSRKVYFDGVGTEITGTQKTEQAIKLSGLDYTVQKEPLYLGNGKQVEDIYANVRTDTGDVIGKVGKNYTVVQNQEAFDFLDSLVDGGANIVNAGSIKNGQTSYIVAETEPMKILGDEFKPYILFTNSFDGGTSIQAMFTPIRVFCSNCYVAATKQAQNKITIKHSKNAKDNLYIARDTLLQNTKYLEYLKKRSEELALEKFTSQQFEASLDEFIPGLHAEEGIIRERAEQLRQVVMNAYNAEDLRNYNDSIYKAIMAMADVDSHKESIRNTKNEFVFMQRVMGGMVMLNQYAQLLQKRTGTIIF